MNYTASTEQFQDHLAKQSYFIVGFGISITPKSPVHAVDHSSCPLCCNYTLLDSLCQEFILKYLGGHNLTLNVVCGGKDAIVAGAP